MSRPTRTRSPGLFSALQSPPSEREYLELIFQAIEKPLRTEARRRYERELAEARRRRDGAREPAVQSPSGQP